MITHNNHNNDSELVVDKTNEESPMTSETFPMTAMAGGFIGLIALLLVIYLDQKDNESMGNVQLKCQKLLDEYDENRKKLKDRDNSLIINIICKG